MARARHAAVLLFSLTLLAIPAQATGQGQIQEQTQDLPAEAATQQSEAESPPAANPFLSLTVTEVMGEGAAQGTGFEARDRAMQAAARGIVLECIEGMLGTRDNLTIYEPILTNPSKYLISSRVVDYAAADETTKVRVRAMADLPALGLDAAKALLNGVPGEHTAMVLIAVTDGSEGTREAEEGHGGKPRIVTEGEAIEALAEPLRRAGLKLEDAALLNRRYSPEALMGRVLHADEYLPRLAYENGVDTIVLARALQAARPTTPAALAHAGKCVVEVLVSGPDAAGAAPVNRFQHESVVYSGQPDEGTAMALIQACGHLASRVALAGTVTAARAHTPNRDIHITLQGAPSESQVAHLLETVRAFPRVEKAEVLFLGTREAGMTVNYTGPVRPLVEYLIDAPYESFELEPHMIIDRRMQLRVEPMQGG